MKDRKIRVFIVDDQPIVRKGTLALLNQFEDIEVVAEAGNGQEAIELVEKGGPKVLFEFSKPQPEKAIAEPLIERETEVLRWLACGLENLEIAERLNITEVTVRSHVNRIFSKLHLANRVQAALYALREGLISLDKY